MPPLGLITPEIVPYLRRDEPLEYVKKVKPSYLVYNDKNFSYSGIDAELLVERSYYNHGAREVKKVERTYQIYKLIWQ